MKSRHSAITVRENDIHDLSKIISSLEFKDEKGRKPHYVWTDFHCESVLNDICRTISLSANDYDRDHYENFKQKLSISHPRHERIRFVAKIIKDTVGEEKVKVVSPRLLSLS